MKFSAIQFPMPQRRREKLKKLLLVMKLTTFLLIIALVQASAKGYSQITLHEKNAPFDKVMQSIKKQTGYTIFYDESVPKSNITINVNNATVQETLDKCFVNLAVTYKIVDNNILLKAKELNLIDKIKEKITDVFANIDVQGRVVDENGQALAGATIRQKNGNAATITDANGAFTLKNLDPGAVITISFIGYSPLELTVKAEMGTIRMSKSADKLDEVKVIAYGQTTQRLETGNVTHINAETIDKQPVTNVLAAIEGRVPGLLITQQSGLPNANYSVEIRGKASMFGHSDPLFVIDGIPYTPNLSSSQSNSTGTPLNYINTIDIESIDVLKDADATAIYGSRGANGVIMITTKKGKAGAMKVNASVKAGFENKPMFSFLNTQQYLQMRTEANKNDGITTPQAGDFDLNGIWDINSYTNWQKLLTGNTAHYTNAQLSISGGSFNTQYLISGSFNRQTNTFPGDFPDQIEGLHFNIGSHSDNNRFKVSLTGSFTSNLNTTIIGDLSSQINLAPDAPSPYLANGNLNWANSTFSPFGGNPLAPLYTPDVTSVKNMTSSSTISYQIFPGLEIKSTLGYMFAQVSDRTATPKSAQDPALGPVNKANFANSTNESYSIDPQLTYFKSFGKGTLNAIIGSSIQQLTINTSGISASNYATDALLQSPSGAASISASGTFTQYKYAALFARINYNYADKYIMNLSGRRDGSSRFGPGKQYANFGSVGGAWIFTKEDWSIFPNFLSFGKLRASYGLTGNDQIGDYKYLNLYRTTPTTATYQNTVGLFPSSLNNPDYAWETNKKMEFGIDLGFLKDRILLSMDYYRQRSSNQLVAAPLPTFVGPGSINVNLPAVIQNQGFDLTLSSTNIQSKDFRWKSNFNISLNRNELASYPNFATSGYANFYALGKPITGGYSFHSVGVNPTTGLYQFTDSKGNLTYTPLSATDRTVFVDKTPKYYGGLENSFGYKGFELSFFLEFIKQKGDDIGFYANAYPSGFVGQNILSSVWENTWHKPGDIARYEQVTGSSSSAATAAYYNAAGSDFGLVDASFIRLKTLSLHYILPSKIIDKLHVSSVRIYLEGQNLYTFTGLHTDPIIYYNTTPLLRTFVTGLQVTL